MASRHNKTGRSKSGPPFVQLMWYLLDSEAWRSLTPAQRSTYVEIRRRFNGYNNGAIPFSVREAAERCRINKDTACKAFVVLEQRGFIECATPGSFNYKLRHATEWRLTDEICHKTGQKPTKAFVRWRPSQAA